MPSGRTVRSALCLPLLFSLVFRTCLTPSGSRPQAFAATRVERREPLAHLCESRRAAATRADAAHRRTRVPMGATLVEKDIDVSPGALHEKAGDPDDTSESNVLSRLVGGRASNFMRSIFGRQWMLTRRLAPEIRFGIQDCLDLLNGVGAEKMKSAKLVKTMVLEDGDEAFEKMSDRKGITSFVTSSRLTSPSDLIERGDGWTFTLVLGNGVNEDMHRLHHELWALLGLPIGMNAYLTPPSAQGLSIHSDPHDVFVLQQSGSKDWTIFEEDFRTVQKQITLTEGDVLYLPAGVPHCAKSRLDVSSLHVSVSVYRGDFDMAGMLAAWLEVHDHPELHSLTQEAVSNIQFMQKRLSNRWGPWDRPNQLLSADVSIPLLRAFDEADLPEDVIPAALAELTETGRHIAERLEDASDSQDVDLTRRLVAVADVPAQEQSKTFWRSIFLAREYHLNGFYTTHQSRPLPEGATFDGPLTHGTVLRRPEGARAMLSADGSVLVNGHHITSFPESAMPAIRFCLGLYTGASGKEFFLGDVPGQEKLARATVKTLLQYGALERASGSQRLTKDFSKTSHNT